MRKMKNRIWKKGRIGIMLLIVTGMFCACGDDLSVQVPVDYRDFGEPLETEGSADSTYVTRDDNADVVDAQESTQDDFLDIFDGEDIPKEDTAADTAEDVLAEAVESEEPENFEVSITISATGDVTLGTHQNQDYGYSFRQEYDNAEDESYFFENVYDIFSQDDMTLVNLEGVLTLSEEMQEGHTYNIKGDPEYVNILLAGSVEVAGMANNHKNDYGEQGIKDTVAALEGAGIPYAYDSNVVIYETQGIRIGYVSANEVSWGVAVEKHIQDGIAKLQEEDVDLILVSVHWGIERENYPEAYQRNLGKKCIDWGADLVIGHHPHVLQGIEEYQGKYIVYSLGNFCFGANRNPADKDTMIFQQTFTFVNGEKQEDREIRIIPCSVSSVKERNDFRPTPLEGEDGQRVIDRINKYSKDYGVEFAEDGTLVEN